MNEICTFRFTWYGEKQTPYKAWRPELAVCQMENPQATLTLPSHTLWYGLYKIILKPSIRTQAARQRRSVIEGIDDTGIIMDESPFDYNAIVEEKFDPILNLDDTEATLYTTSPEVAYVHVVPTPLVAHIKRQEEGELTNANHLISCY